MEHHRHVVELLAAVTVGRVAAAAVGAGEEHVERAVHGADLGDDRVALLVDQGDRLVSRGRAADVEDGVGGDARRRDAEDGDHGDEHGEDRAERVVLLQPAVAGDGRSCGLLLSTRLSTGRHLVHSLPFTETQRIRRGIAGHTISQLRRSPWQKSGRCGRKG